jgi:hypothetical protein
MTKEPLKSRDLPRWARCKVTCTIDWVERTDEVITFNKMDWHYGQRFTHDWHMLVFNADFKKEEKDFYSIIT